MKSKLRKITVQENVFVWNVKQIDPNYICLRVWAKGVKAYPWFQLRYRFDDPWLHFGEILAAGEKAQRVFKASPLKPKYVAQVIGEILTVYGYPQKGFTTLNLEPNGEEKLTPIENALLPRANPFGQDKTINGEGSGSC